MQDRFSVTIAGYSTYTLTDYLGFAIRGAESKNNGRITTVCRGIVFAGLRSGNQIL